MNDPLRVRRVEGVGNLDGDVDEALDGQRPPADVPGQHLAVEQFHGEKMPAVVLAYLVNRADVGMVQAGNRAGLVLEARDTVKPARRDKFEDDFPAEGQVLGVVDDGAGAFADLGNQPVVRNRLSSH